MRELLNKKIILLLAIFSLLFVTPTYAYIENGRIGLLTVSETINGTVSRGGVADLYLTIKPGSGRIFIDSFPVSRVDTQITMRFASELACDYLQVECNDFDFFYTIRADSSIVGGPSAGAAATVLTVAMLDGAEIDTRTIMTGTINSGYLIGPVGGLNEKTLAAQNFGYTKAVIPKWDSTNETFDAQLDIEIVQVSTLEEALFEFTGKNYSVTYSKAHPSQDYENVMKKITVDLCSKYGGFSNGAIIMPNISSFLDENESGDFFDDAILAIDEKKYYSAASFCFGGNVRISRELYSNFSNIRLKQEYARMLGELSIEEDELRNRDINTLTELETYMIVKERLDDARELLRDQDIENISSNDIAYANERISTADAWSNFFDLESPDFDSKSKVLEVACSKKIAETEERINYLQVYYPRNVDRDDLRKAYDYRDSRDYALCIFTAAKAKADVDVVLGALFLNEEDVGGLLSEKLLASEKVISRQSENGLFPILGYSYFEYSNSLKNESPYSALLYAEYALELSNLDMYVGTARQKLDIPFYFDKVHYMLFGGGVLFGLILASLVWMFAVKNYKNNSSKVYNSRSIISKSKKKK
ncbi:MAG: S16 family serine protease [Candidatus Woesearchaeota archaeon]